MGSTPSPGARRRSQQRGYEAAGGRRGAALLGGYYVYLPLPPGVCEPEKLMLLDALFRSFMTAGELLHALGLLHRVHLLNFLVSLVENVPARGVPTRVYRPRAGAEPKRGVLYFHGGWQALRHTWMRSYDLLCRQMSEDLDAVIMSVEFGLDPDRLCVSGDSAGANLAAAVAQTLSSDPPLSPRFKLQALVYPVLQALDFHTSSYQQNQAVPILYRPVMARFWLQYLNADPLLEPSVLKNLHSSALDADTRAKSTGLSWSRRTSGNTTDRCR
ncbi:hypothetical protein WMY93_029948 [Mugilogobius chulae]|uniref:Alpha/beta hydrolase fold-3 domain-containing protein n=1 Tax=Mugilogobius chulae TaxID=88201 RepID=A0AAW0MXB0_9GOBI